jgi:hypothetical protein
MWNYLIVLEKKMKKLIRDILCKGLVFSAVVAVAGLGTPVAYAALTTNSTLSQQIDAGALNTSIRDAGGAVVTSPSFSMGLVTVSTVSQTATGTFGTNTQRIAVENPGNAAGWTLSIAATSGDVALWTSGSNTYDFNGTAAQGSLALDPSAAVLALTGPSTVTGVTKGVSTPFTTGAITLLSASALSDDVWSGYLTGVGVTQTIPAFQPSGAYTLSLTQTVVTQ